MTALENFRNAMLGGGAPREPGDIGLLLAACVRRVCEESGLEAEIYDGGPLVTMFFTPERAWEAVIVAPNEYQLYPGILSSDGVSVVWPNIWVADNYDFEKFVGLLEQEIEAALAEGERA